MTKIGFAASLGVLLLTSTLEARDWPIMIERPVGGEVYFPGQVQTVVLYRKTRAKSVLIEISRDGGQTFETLGTINNKIRDKYARNRLQWTVGEPYSSNAVIRATSTDSRKPGTGVSNSFSIGAANTDGSGTGFRFVLKSGDSMTGPLTLSGDPTTGLHASTKTYVDNANAGQDAAQATRDGTQDTGIASKVAKAGDTMTGPLILSGDPTANLHAATKEYVDGANNTQDTNQAATDGAQDAAIAGKVSKSGDTMTGNLKLPIAGPVANEDATTKKYVDDANGAQDTAQATTDAAQDAAIAGKLNVSGGTMTGFLTLDADPSANLHAATKQYVDNGNTTQDTTIAGKVSKSGDTMTGALVLSGAPTVDLHAATKKYVDDGNSAQDTAIAGKVNKGGDTMTGALVLSGAPTVDLHAATKKYVDDGNSAQDTAISGKVNKAGDTMTGALTVNGVVESTSGGIKFPDGTVQATAAGMAMPFSGTDAGTGDSFVITKTGASGKSGKFEISNASNSSPALHGLTNGSGPGVLAEGRGTSGIALEVKNGAFRVTGAGNNTSTTAFVLRFTMPSTGNLDFWSINHPLINGDPNAILIVTPKRQPSTGSIPPDIRHVFYQAGGGGRWNIKVANPFSNSRTYYYNVLIIKP